MPETPGASSTDALVRMKRQRQHDTMPELLIRRKLWREGLRYSIDVSPLAGVRRRADIVFKRVKLAAYIDGCFWHSCPIHATFPKHNSEWWEAKLKANRERDADTTRKLEEAGWKVIRIWEHEDPEDAAERIGQLVRTLRAATL